jgi:hypothetical protein
LPGLVTAARGIVWFGQKLNLNLNSN